jgi:hypothetical protein
MRYKFHINSLIYNLVYPGFLGSMIYDLLLAVPVNSDTTYWTTEVILKWLITFIYLLDYFHLYGDVERDVKLEDRTFLYFACDVAVSLLFFAGYYFTKNHEYGNALICISLVPLCFFLYKSQLKTDIKFHLIFMIGGLTNIAIFFWKNSFVLFSRRTEDSSLWLGIVLGLEIIAYLYYIFFVYKPKVTA